MTLAQKGECVDDEVERHDQYMRGFRFHIGKLDYPEDCHNKNGMKSNCTKCKCHAFWDAIC